MRIMWKEVFTKFPKSKIYMIKIWFQFKFNITEIFMQCKAGEKIIID